MNTALSKGKMEGSQTTSVVAAKRRIALEFAVLTCEAQKLEVVRYRRDL